MIGIPWRATPERQEILDLLLEYLGTHLPKWPIVFGDSGHKEFNRAATRNQLVKEISRNSPVAVILDADTFIHPKPLTQAVQVALDHLELVYPFERYIPRARRERFADLMALKFPAKGGHRGTGQCYVVRPEVWEAFGGQDEQFVGWGGEDDATYIAAETLMGVRRRRGVAVGFDHPALRFGDDPHFAEAGARMRIYRALRGRPEELREFIRCGRPLDWPIRDGVRAPNPEFP